LLASTKRRIVFTEPVAMQEHSAHHRLPLTTLRPGKRSRCRAICGMCWRPSGRLWLAWSDAPVGQVWSFVDRVVWKSGDGGGTAVAGGQHRRWVCGTLRVSSALVLVVIGANVRLRMLSSGHRFAVATVPSAPVVIVPGAKVGPDGLPMAYLRGRLDVAIELLAAKKVGEILISGDSAGRSGDEIASMRRYLLDHGVDPALVRADGAGLSTRATCERAHRLFGIDRAIIVTQPQHAPRAIALCRGAGIDADGVDAYCECTRITLARNSIREWLAAPKAVTALIRSVR